MCVRSAEACPSFLPLTREPEDPRTDAHHLTAAPLLHGPAPRARVCVCVPVCVCVCVCVRVRVRDGDGVSESVYVSEDVCVLESNVRMC